MVKVLIADDHQLFAEGLSQALSSLPDISVVAFVGDGSDVVELIDVHQPDVIVVDLEMPVVGGIEVLRRSAKDVGGIVVTMHADEKARSQAAQAGAKAFFSKSAPLSDLAAAVRAVAAGEDLVALGGPELLAVLDRHRKPVLSGAAAAITERERQILQLMAEGVTSTEDLAEMLYISHKTVKNHLANIFDKLVSTDRAQAVVEAIRLGLVTPK